MVATEAPMGMSHCETTLLCQDCRCAVIVGIFLPLDKPIEGKAGKKFHGGPQEWTVVVADTFMGAQIHSAEEFFQADPCRRANPFRKVQLVADLRAVGVDHKDRRVRREGGLVDHDSSERSYGANDGDTVFLQSFADCGRLVVLNLVCASEAVQVEPHDWLGKKTTGCLSHLDVDSDEATLGIDERDIDVGLLALVKASEGDDTDVAYVEEPDIVLEAAIDGSGGRIPDCLEVGGLPLVESLFDSAGEEPRIVF